MARTDLSPYRGYHITVNNYGEFEAFDSISDDDTAGDPYSQAIASTMTLPSLKEKLDAIEVTAKRTRVRPEVPMISGRGDAGLMTGIHAGHGYFLFQKNSGLLPKHGSTHEAYYDVPIVRRLLAERVVLMGQVDNINAQLDGDEPNLRAKGGYSRRGDNEDVAVREQVIADRYKELKAQADAEEAANRDAVFGNEDTGTECAE